jgi:hypothetical protein
VCWCLCWQLCSLQLQLLCEAGATTVFCLRKLYSGVGGVLYNPVCPLCAARAQGSVVGWLFCSHGFSSRGVCMCRVAQRLPL